MTTKFYIAIIIYTALHLAVIYGSFAPGKLVKLTAPDGMECYVYKTLFYTSAPECNDGKYNYDTGYGDATYALPPLDFEYEFEGKED